MASRMNIFKRDARASRYDSNSAVASRYDPNSAVAGGLPSPRGLASPAMPTRRGASPQPSPATALWRSGSPQPSGDEPPSPTPSGARTPRQSERRRGGARLPAEVSPTTPRAARRRAQAAGEADDTPRAAQRGPQETTSATQSLPLDGRQQLPTLRRKVCSSTASEPTLPQSSARVGPRVAARRWQPSSFQLPARDVNASACEVDGGLDDDDDLPMCISPSAVDREVSQLLSDEASPADMSPTSAAALGLAGFCPMESSKTEFEDFQATGLASRGEALLKREAERDAFQAAAAELGRLGNDERETISRDISRVRGHSQRKLNAIIERQHQFLATEIDSDAWLPLSRVRGWEG